METNEIMTNNEAVVEATEDIVTTVASSDNGLKTIAKIGGTTVVTGAVLYLGYKYIVKPIIAKVKAKNEPEDLEAVDSLEDDSVVSDVENVEEAE